MNAKAAFVIIPRISGLLSVLNLIPIKTRTKAHKEYSQSPKSIFAIFLSCLLFNIQLLIVGSAQGTWIQKANFGGAARHHPASFSIGTKGYIGTGDITGGVLQKDVWEWDQATDTWKQIADFGGTARNFAVGFSIGAKGYIGTGQSGISYKQDFWEWDQATNIWTQRANFGGTARSGAACFSIGTKGYLGTGEDANGNTKDFWEWDQATDVWTKKADFGGGIRRGAVGFSIGNKGYIGTGAVGKSAPLTKDFWEWDQVSDVWTQKADYGGVPVYFASGFSICTKGYIGIGFASTGYKQDFWEWNQATDIWTQQANFGGTARSCSGYFSIGTYLYIGTGHQYTIDFWEWGAVCSQVTSQNILCNAQCTGTSTVTTTGGTAPYTYSWNSSPVQTTQTAIGLCAGNYTVTVTDALTSSTSSVFTITQPITPLTNTITATNIPCDSICNGTAEVGAVGGSPPYAYIWTPSGGINAKAIDLCANSYSVIITDINGCSKTDTATVIQILKPIATATANPVNITFGDSTMLVADGGATYQWFPSTGLSDPTLSNPVASPIQTTTYCVTVTDAITGCSDNDCITIHVENLCGILFIPNAFSPNGDGENDTLKVYIGNLSCIKEYRLVIFNRWGEKVFESYDPKTGWDGTLRDKGLDPAVFVYYLKVTLATGEKINKKGNISLVR
ncbi:MAG: gliding motility-associated C-terminal domain-containing protein [Bacteroidetes bacterium]|nr:gliding motility-associated C-terminal domain-containing protein [Bacteroidota bacterium]